MANTKRTEKEILETVVQYNFDRILSIVEDASCYGHTYVKI